MPRSNALRAPGPFLALMLKKYKLNPSKLSEDIHMSQSAIRLIVLGKTKISVPVALRLAKYFNTNPEFWLAMQMKWDIAEAAKDKELMKIVRSISKVKKSTTERPAVQKKSAPKKTAPVRKPAAAKKSAVKKSTAVKKRPTAKAKKTVKRGRPAAKR